MSLEIENAEGRLLRQPTLTEDEGEVDHKESQVDGSGERCLVDIHEILQTPELLGIAEVKLDLETQRVILDDLIIRLVQVAAEEDDVSAGVGGEIGLENDDNVERLRKEFVQGSELVDIGANLLLRGALLPMALRQVGILDLVAILFS